MNTYKRYAIDEDAHIEVEMCEQTQETFIRFGAEEICLGYLDNEESLLMADSMAAAIYELTLLARELRPAINARAVA